MDNVIVDISQYDGNFDLAKLAAECPPWIGVMIKATQGNFYSGGTWFQQEYAKAIQLAKANPANWFVLPYHYLDFGTDGAAQARYFLSALRAVSDFEPPFYVVDIERGGQKTPPTKADVTEKANAFMTEMRVRTKRDVICYGGETLRSLQLKVSDLGMKYGWVADYDSVLSPSIYKSIGLDLSTCVAWQYCGVEGSGKIADNLAGYPKTTPAGIADISAVIINGGGNYGLEFFRNANRS